MWQGFDTLYQAFLSEVYSDFYLLTSISIRPIKMSSIS